MTVPVMYPLPPPQASAFKDPRDDEIRKREEEIARREAELKERERNVERLGPLGRYTKVVCK